MPVARGEPHCPSGRSGNGSQLSPSVGTRGTRISSREIPMLYLSGFFGQSVPTSRRSRGPIVPENPATVSRVVSLSAANCTRTRYPCSRSVSLATVSPTGMGNWPEESPPLTDRIPSITHAPARPRRARREDVEASTRGSLSSRTSRFLGGVHCVWFRLSRVRGRSRMSRQPLPTERLVWASR